MRIRGAFRYFWPRWRGVEKRPGTAARVGAVPARRARRARWEPEQDQWLAGRQAGRVQLGQRAALYCRVWTADQSCVRQERDLTAFADPVGYQVVGIFKETGSGVRPDRTERRKVMALAQACQIDAVLVTEPARSPTGPWRTPLGP